MKNKIIAFSVSLVIFSFAFNVLADSQNSGAVNQIQQKTQTSNQGEDSQIQSQNNEQVQEGGEVDNQGQEKQQQTAVKNHKSVVADFVQSLIKIADKDIAAGKEIRTIAQQQNQSEDISGQAMEKAQNRSMIKTFFLGSDYKNLGILRSEMVQTQNRLNRLNELAENIQNQGDKIELKNQIQLLEQEQVQIESFIGVQEGKFSMFGWVIRRFSK